MASLEHRRLFLASGVIAALQQYFAARERAGAPTHPQSELFWSQQTGRGYSIKVMRLMLTDVLRVPESNRFEAPSDRESMICVTRW
jgi:hypothetical protein